MSECVFHKPMLKVILVFYSSVHAAKKVGAPAPAASRVLSVVAPVHLVPLELHPLLIAYVLTL